MYVWLYTWLQCTYIWYLWDNPITVIQATNIPGGVEIPRVWCHPFPAGFVVKSAPPNPPFLLKISATVFGTSKSLRYAHVSQGVCILWYILYTSIYIDISIPRKRDRTRYDLRRRSPKASPPHRRSHSDRLRCRESALKPPGNSPLKMMLKLYSKLEFM